jgi:hypothetical protein
LTKEPHEWLDAYGQLDIVREQPFFRGIDWHALQEKRVKPPQKPEIVKVSSTNSVFISFYKRFLFRLHVKFGNNDFRTRASFI